MKTLSEAAFNIDVNVGMNFVCKIDVHPGLPQSSRTTSCTNCTKTGSLFALINTARQRVDTLVTFAAVKLESIDTTIQHVSRMRESTSDDA